MKYIIALVIISGIISCLKDSPVSIVGKWNIVNDSIFLEGNQMYPGENTNYIGTQADYFNFTSDGNLYVKKGTSFDTATYHLLSDDKIELIYFSANGISFGTAGAIRGTYHIINLTAHSVSLSLSGLTPEGRQAEIINLKRGFSNSVQ